MVSRRVPQDQQWIGGMAGSGLGKLSLNGLISIGNYLLIGISTQLVINGINGINGFLYSCRRLGKAGRETRHRPSQVLARIYCAFSAMWSLGANLHEAGGFRQRDFGTGGNLRGWFHVVVFQAILWTTS